MTTKIKAHGLFEVWSADEVAECLEGVGTGDLYRRLYELMVPRKPTPGLDYREIPDDFSDRCLANRWDELSEEHQAWLNELAEKFEKASGWYEHPTWKE